MTFKPGQQALLSSATGKAGPTRYVKQSAADLMAMIRAKCGPEWDPVVGMAYVAAFGVLPTYNQDAPDEIIGYTPVGSKERIECHKEVAQYLYAKKKAVELTNGDDGEGKKLGLRISFVKPTTQTTEEPPKSGPDAKNSL